MSALYELFILITKLLHFAWQVVLVDPKIHIFFWIYVFECSGSHKQNRFDLFQRTIVYFFGL